MTVKTIPLVVISPVRNEARLISRTLDSMLAQSWRPAEWILVDDGSTDDTTAVIARYAEAHSWIRCVPRQDRGFRQLGAGVIAAFDEGRSRITTDGWQFIAKLDGDMSFGPRYLEIMVGTLLAEPRLACVSGKVFRPDPGGEVEEFIIDEATAGQFKLYRREAFEAIGGITQTILWDGIDFHRCRMMGWDTRSFFHHDAKLIHHRQMGSSDKNIYRGRMRLGKGIWFMGYHPLYATASGLFRMHERPYVIGGLIIIGSFFAAALRREPRFDDQAFRQYLQRWQLARLRALPGRAGRRLLRRVGRK